MVVKETPRRSAHLCFAGGSRQSREIEVGKAFANDRRIAL
jgi:hypothetical protein